MNRNMFDNNKFRLLNIAFIFYFFLPVLVFSVSLETEIQESKILMERLKRVVPGSRSADALALEIMQNYQCKLLLKKDKELGVVFHDLMYGADGKHGLAKKILDKAKLKISNTYPSLAERVESIRNQSSINAKKPPMDLDFGVLAKDSDDLKHILNEIKMSDGSVNDFHKKLDTALKDSFKEVGEDLGLSSPNPEKAFIAGTTGFHPEAYKDIGAIKGDTPLKKWISQSTDVSRYKIHELKKLVDEGVISAESAAQEAARGTLKDFDKVERTFAGTAARTGKRTQLSKINDELRKLLVELDNAKSPEAIRHAIDKIEVIQGKNGVFKACDNIIDNMEAAWKLSLKSDPELLLKKLFMELLPKDDYLKTMVSLKRGEIDKLPRSAVELRKKIFNIVGRKQTSLSYISMERLFNQMQDVMGLDKISGNTKQIMIELLENLEKTKDTKVLSRVLGDYLADNLVKIRKLMPSTVKSSLAKRLASRIPLKTLDNSYTSLELGDGRGVLGVDGLIGIAMTYHDIDNIMDKNLSPDEESRELQKAIVSNMPIIGDLMMSINTGIEAGFEGSYSKGAQSAAYLVIAVAGVVPGAQVPALIAGLGMAAGQVGLIAWDTYWDRRLIWSWVKSGVWDKDNGKLLKLKDANGHELSIDFHSLVDHFNEKYKYDYDGMSIRDSILDYTQKRLLSGNKNVKSFEDALYQLYPKADLSEAIRQPGKRGEGLIRAAIKLAGDGENIDRNIALAIYRKYKKAVDKQSLYAIHYLKTQAEREYQARHHVGEASEIFRKLRALGKRIGVPLVDRVNSIFSSFTGMVKSITISPFVIESLPLRQVQMAERYYHGYSIIEKQLKEIKHMFQMVHIKMPSHNLSGYLEIDAPRMADLKTTYMNRAIAPARRDVENVYRKITGKKKYHFNPNSADHCQLELFQKIGSILVRKVEAEDRRLLLEQWSGKRSAAETSRDKALQHLKESQKNEDVKMIGIPLPTLKALYKLEDAQESLYAWTHMKWLGTDVYSDALMVQQDRIKKLEREYEKAKNTAVLDLKFCLHNLPEVAIVVSKSKLNKGDSFVAEAKIVKGEIPKEFKWEWFAKGGIILNGSYQSTAKYSVDSNGTVGVKLFGKNGLIVEKLKYIVVESNKSKKIETAKEEGQESDKTVDLPNEDKGVITQETENQIDKLPSNSGKKVKHGAGGSVSGMFPSETFNGLQISYSFSGGSMPIMKDKEGFTMSRHYEGRLGDGMMTLTGTARATWSPYVVLAVSVSAGEKHDERTYKFKAPGGESFNLSIPIPKDAVSGGFSIGMSAEYGNGESRGVMVTGSLTADGPEGESPKGTEELKVSIKKIKTPINVNEKIDIAAKVQGGRFPYTYTWKNAEGSEEKAVFQSNIAGEHVITLHVTDIDGRSATSSVTLTVKSPQFEVIGLPKNPVYGSSAVLNVRVKNGGGSEYHPLWQSSEPGVIFDPPEGMQTKITFGRMKKILVWVQVPQDNGGKTIESKQVESEVISPKFILKLDKKIPYVGEEVHAKITTASHIAKEMIQWFWVTPQTSNRMEYDDAASEIGFTLKDAKPLKIEAEARVPHWGDVIGRVGANVTAKPYNVDVKVLGPLGPKPMIWKEGKGLVEVAHEIAVFQNVRLKATIAPVPKDTDLRYVWKVNEDSHFAGGMSGSEVTLNRSQVGTCIATVTVTDKDGNVLGKGSGSFSVTVSQKQIEKGKQKAQDRKKAKQLLRKARQLWEEGQLKLAIAKVAQAHKFVEKDKEITKTFKAMQIQKKQLDDKLREASGLIKQGKLDAAKKILDSAAMISAKYEKYKEVLKQLNDAKKKAEEKKKQIAKLLKEAKILKDAGKLDEAIKVLKKGSKEFPGNKEMDKLLREVQKRQKDARKKMAEGQKQWKNGILDKAVSTLKEAAKINVSNKQIIKVLKGMQGQKKMIEDILKKADQLIGQKKFKQAKRALAKGEYVSKKYPPYMEMIKKLDIAKKKDEELARALLKKAKNLWNAGKLGDAIATLTKGSKEFVSNKKINQSLQKMKQDKKKLDGTISKAENYIDQEKFTEAERLLEKAGKISKKYLPYIEAMKRLNLEKERVEEEKKRQVDARKKLTKGQTQWKNGMLDKAVSTLKEAAKIDPSNRQIAKVLKVRQGQKKMLDDALTKAGKLIEQKKFKEAQNVLKKVEHISSKYPPYIKTVQKLKGAKEVSPPPSKPKDLAYAKSFAGKWNSTFGVMKLSVRGLYISGNYTHDKGRISATLSKDGKNMKGTWAEAPTYSGSTDAGKMYFKLSSDGNKINGLWSYGDAVPTRSWTGIRIVDTKPQPSGPTQAGHKAPKERKPANKKPTRDISSLVGSWSFGRSKHYGKPVKEHLCNLTLTDELVKGVGYKINSCHSNESYWVLEGNVLLFIARDGTITTKFTKVSPGYWEGTYVGSLHSGEDIVHYLAKSDKETNTDTASDIIGNTTTSTTYTPNTKGDVFNGGHWAGASGRSDWLQKDFSSPQLVTGVYIGRASTDITTDGFRLVLKLRNPNGQWITIDELHNTNINRTKLSGGAIGKSIPPYKKVISPAIEAKAFRLEFYGHGWFDATDIRIYTKQKPETDKPEEILDTEGIDGIVDIDIVDTFVGNSVSKRKEPKQIMVSYDKNLFPPHTETDPEANPNDFVIDGDQSQGWVELFFRNPLLHHVKKGSLTLRLTIAMVPHASSRHGIVVYHNGTIVGRVGAVSHGEIVKIPLDVQRIGPINGTLMLVLKAAGTDAAYIRSKITGKGAVLEIGENGK